MTDFLTTLATRTLGLAPVMQPMIASIFTTSEIYSAFDGEYESFGVNSVRQLQEIPSISQTQLENPVFNSIDTQSFSSNQPTSSSEIKSNLVNPAQIASVKVEYTVTPIDLISEIDEIRTVISEDWTAPKIPFNHNQIKINLVNPHQTTEAVSTQIDSIPKDLSKTRHNNQDTKQINNYLQNNLIMAENTSDALNSILSQYNPKYPNLEHSNVVTSQNTIPSASLSQKIASKVKPVVMTQPSSIYPQWELESRQAKTINQIQPVPPTPTPTITVSIGRIEVKASHQSTPQKSHKSTRKEIGLSLQDYLKQRQGGK